MSWEHGEISWKLGQMARARPDRARAPLGLDGLVERGGSLELEHRFPFECASTLGAPAPPRLRSHEMRSRSWYGAVCTNGWDIFVARCIWWRFPLVDANVHDPPRSAVTILTLRPLRPSLGAVATTVLSLSACGEAGTTLLGSTDGSYHEDGTVDGAAADSPSESTGADTRDATGPPPDATVADADGGLDTGVFEDAPDALDADARAGHDAVALPPSPCPDGGEGPLFFPAVLRSVPTLPWSVVARDFDGDGVLDLAVAGAYGHSEVVLGYGDGTFGPSLGLPVGGPCSGCDPPGVTTGDFNRDGVINLALIGTYNLQLMNGGGDGTFRQGTVVDAGWVLKMVPPVAPDFNADGLLDVVSAGGDKVIVWLGNGDGTLRPGEQYDAAASPFGIITADFNGDGLPDISVACELAGGFDVLLNRGDGTFGSATYYPLLGVAFDTAAADLDGDGILDIAGVSQRGLRIYFGRGDGTFGRSRDLPIHNEEPTAVRVADIDGDGRTDVAFSATYRSTISVLLGRGNGTFAENGFYPTGNNSRPRGFVLEDLNRDAHLDVVTADVGRGSISVLLGTGCKPAPYVVDGGGDAAARDR